MYFISKRLRAIALLLFFFTWTTVAFAQNETDILATNTVIVADDGNGLLDIGESLQITLSVVPEGTVPDITGVQFVLNFDPAILQVAGNPTPGPSISFTDPSPIPFDNTNGTITFLGGNFSGIAGTFEVMTFTVNAIAGSMGTAITFDYTAIPAPKVTAGSINYIGDTPDIVVAVNDPNPNTPPLVSVVSPQQGTDGGGAPTYQDVRFPSGSTIPLVVDATDGDGTISTVEYFDAGDNSLGTGSLTTGTKYQFNLTNALVGAFSFKATATDNGGAMSTSGLSDLITVFERTQAIPGLVEAENFTAQSGSILTQDNGGNDAGGLHIGFIENNSSTTYEVSVANNVTYNVVVRAASNSTGGTITFKDESDNVLGSIAVANTGDGQAYQDFTGQVTFATSGVQDLTLEYTGSATFLFNLNSVSFSEAANVPPTISGIPNQTNNEGDAVSLDLSPFAADSDGTIASYELTTGTLPDGLSLNAATGLISGTLSAVSADNSPYSLTINVRDNAGDLSLSGSSFTWTVNEAGTDNPPTINPIATQEFAEGDFVVVPIQVNDDNNPAASVAIYDISAFGTNNPFTPGATVPGTDYTLTDNGNGSYLLEWNTGAGDGRAYEVRVTANDGVNPPVTAAFDLNIAQPLPGTVQSNTLANPDPWYGANPVAPYTLSIENTAAQNIGFINNGEFAEYLIDIPSGNYILTIAAATNTGTDGVSSTDISFSEESGTGFSALGTVNVPNLLNSGWQDYATYQVPVTISNSGLQTVRLDFLGGVNVDFFSLDPAPDNEIPVITLTPAGDQTMAEGETLVIDLAVSDPDGNIQNNTSVTGPGFMVETLTTNSATDYASTLSFSPITGDAGVYTVTVTTNDGVNPAVTTTFQLTVTPPGLPCDVKYRVNAAGPVIAGNGGDDWQADLTYVTSGGSNTFSTSATIDNATAYPTALFQTERFQPNMNDLVYAFPVVPGGEYEVRLLHAEIFSLETNVGNNRIFDVLIEGVLVEDDYRVYTAAGNNLFTAVVESYTVTVNDNLLDIVLSPVNQNAAIKAIEICTISEPNVTTYTITATAGANGSIAPSGAVTVTEGSNQSFAITPDPGYAVADVLVDGVSVGAVTSYEFTNVLADATIDAGFALAPFEAIYVNAGGGAYTAQDGRVFAADNGSTTGGTYPAAGSAAATNLAGIDFANTQDDELFRTERFGDFSYSFPVPDGDYIVELFFAEIFHGITGGSSALPGERIFDVSIEGGSSGLTALDLLDPEAGGAFDPATGLVKSFAVTVSDGVLDIALSTTVDNAKINALCIREDDGSLNAPPTFDPVAGTSVPEGDQAVVAFSAMDDDAVTTYALQLVDDATGVEVDPANYNFNFVSTGGTLEWNTTVGDAGSYTGTLLAFDGLDVSSTSFSVTVDPLSYTITAGAGAGGTITPSGAVTVPAGTDQTFNFTPDPGFTVAQILVDGTPVATAAEYTFSNVQADATIQVSFSEGNAPPTVTITAPADGITVVRGADITFEATATDPEQDDLTPSINWSSSDPQFNVVATGSPVVGKLRKLGAVTVTASVFDDGGLLGTDAISLIVPPPTITFAAPAEGATITGTSVTVDVATSGLLLDEDEHFHFYINPVDPNNPDYNDRISTFNQPGQTTFTFTSDDGIVLGANTIVVVAATSSHVEFTDDSARDVVNFNVDPNTNVFLTIDPAITNVNVNDIFTVDILLEANDQEVNGAQAFIDYDQTVLKALSITAGSTFGFTLTQVIDNSAGQIGYAAGSTGTTNLPSGTFVLATVQFEAIGGPTSALSFSSISPRETKVTAADSGNSILTGVNGGVVNVALDPVVCNIISAIPGTQTCEGGGYSQEVVVTYDGNGNGNLVVNGQSFAPTGSPQTITLTGLVADGLPVDLAVAFPDASIVCDFFQAAAFTAPVVPTYTVTGTNPTSCLGAEGSLLISGLQADTDYEVSIDGGTNSGTRTSDANGEILIATLVSGQYDIIVALDQCGPPAQTVVLTDPDSPTYTVSGSDPTVCGVNNGSITISGLVPNTTYSVDLGTGASPMVFTTNAQGEHVLTNLGADDYSIKVTSLTKCAGMAMPVTLSDPAGPAFAATGTDPTTCGGTGGISISELSPDTEYTVAINDGDAIPYDTDGNGVIVISGLIAGDYAVVVGLGGCAEPATNVMLNDPAAPTYTATGTNPTTCGGADGSITIVGLLGMTAYSVDIGDGTGLVTYNSNGNGEIQISGLGADSYTVVVGLNNCFGAPFPISLADPNAPTYTVNGTNPSACGTSDGAITISGLMAGSNYFVDLGTGASAQSFTADGNGEIGFSNLAPDAYVVTVSQSGCQGAAVPVTLTEPPTPIYTTVGSDPTGCGIVDGSISISGLTPGTEYVVDLSNGAPPQNYTTTAGGQILIGNLPAGNYVVTVSQFDCAGAPQQISLTEPIAPTYTASGINPTACGSNDGSITISGLTPATEYSVNLNNGAGAQLYTSNANGQILIPNLGPASYNVVVSLNSCLGTPLPVQLEEPNAPSYVVTGINPSGCTTLDGSISIAGLLADTEYEVDLGDGESPQLLTSDENGEMVVPNLDGGNYFVTVTLSGCTGASAPVTLTEPGGPTYSATGGDPTGCGSNDGSISITGLTPNTSYSVNIGDGNGPQPYNSDASGAILFADLGPDTYTVVVSLDGCDGTAVNVSLTEPDGPSYTVSSSDPATCGGVEGSIILTGLQPGNDYSVDIGNGEGGQLYTANGNGEISLVGLGAGSYTVVVSFNGCTTVSENPVVLADPDTPTYLVSGTNPTACGVANGGITISGLLANTEYGVDLGSGTPQAYFSDANGIIEIPGLGSGAYSVTVSLFSCSGEAAPILLSDPEAPSFTLGKTDPSDCDINDGSITISGLSATTEYSVDIGDGNGSQLLTTDLTGTLVFNGLAVGGYQVTVSLNGCTSAAQSISLVQSNGVVVAIASISDPSCPGDGTYGITLIVDYAMAPATGTLIVNGQSFTPSGNPPQVIELTGLVPDGQPVDVTAYFAGAQNCGITETALFTAPTIPDYTASLISATPCSGATGEILLAGLTQNTTYGVSVDGGVSYTDFLSSPTGEILIANLSGGDYLVSVRADFCDGPAIPITVPNTDPVTYSVTATSPTDCNEGGLIEFTGLTANQTYSVSVGNGVPDTEYTADASGTIIVEGLLSGTYTVSASANGCTGGTFTVDIFNVAEVDYIPGAAAPSGCGTNDGVIMLIGVLPNTTYTIDYGPVVQLTSNAAGTITVSTDLGPGTYVLTAFLGSCAGPTVEITFDEPGIPTFTAEQVPGSNGLAILLSGLKAGKEYLVDLGTGQAPQTYQSDANGEILLDGLAEGGYSITVTLDDCTSNPVDISILGPTALLSVEVVEPGPFGAVVENDHEVLLNWTTNYEYDNDYFEIQRSIDGTHYYPIGRVDAVGYSTSRREYAFVDSGATRLDAPRLYYRLQQFKFDGSHRLSTVASTPIEAWKGEFRLLYLDMGIRYRVEEVTGVGITTLEIYTINGQLVGRDTYDRVPNVDLRTDHLAEGVYVVIANGTFREKIVIVR